MRRSALWELSLLRREGKIKLFDAFIEEFSTILQRHAARGAAGAGTSAGTTAVR